MKTQQVIRNVEINSAGTQGFTTQSSSKMFKLLITGLYSDKPMSVTREIYSNAFDAHSMSGKADVPFDVIYPTSLNPTFKVRDYGPGISHEDMLKLYTVLGYSSKEDTNDAVGKWGIGRMTPLAYLDTFSVRSIHKGQQAFYTVQLDAKGAPALHTMSPPIPTTEKDGLEVSFPIGRSDIRSFVTAAERMAFGMKVQPNILNKADDRAEFSDAHITLEGKGWQIFEHPSFQRSVYARMGCVFYPISHLETPANFSYKTMLIDFPIGDLEVTASRENLEYDERTKINIKKAFRRIEQEIRDEYETKIAKARNIYEAYKLDRCRPQFVTKAQWNGQDIPRYGYPLYVPRSIKVGQIETWNRPVNAGFTSWRNGEACDATGGSITIWVEDTNKKSKDKFTPKRLRTQLGAGCFQRNTFWVKCDSTDLQQVADLKAFKAQFLEDATIKYIKDLPEYDNSNATGRAVAKIKRSKFGELGWENTEMDDADFKVGGLWMPISNNHTTDEYHRWSCIKNFLKKDVIVVPKTHWKKFEEADQWKELYHEGEKQFKKVKPLIKKALKVRELKSFLGLPSVCRDFKSHIPEVAELEVLLERRKSPYMLPEVWEIFASNEEVETNLVVKKQKEVFEKYPLLRHYSDNNGIDISHYIQYIKLMQKEQKA